MASTQRRTALESGGATVRHALVRGRGAPRRRRCGRARVVRGRGLRPTAVQSAVFWNARAGTHLLVTAPTGSGNGGRDAPLVASLADRAPSADGTRRVRVPLPRPSAPSRRRAGRPRPRPRLRPSASTSASASEPATPPHRRAREGAPRAARGAGHHTREPRRDARHRARDALDAVEHLVLDEAHLLAAGKRGALFRDAGDAGSRSRGWRAAPAALPALSATARPLDAPLFGQARRGGSAVAARRLSARPRRPRARTTRVSDRGLVGAWRPHRREAPRPPTWATLCSSAQGPRRAGMAPVTCSRRAPVVCFHGLLPRPRSVCRGDGHAATHRPRGGRVTSGLRWASTSLAGLARVGDRLAPSVTRLLQAGRADHRPGSPARDAGGDEAFRPVRCAAALAAALRAT